ncbi:hypothetical protein UA08_02980 [Talaromyces atroroseus]|uniref:ERT1/acuK family PAS domain-containing protein n=1 Tax=Talaromyces atroroseus TaxID=1441469 RepID=A0A225AMH2_TALAT|nr:hypothetical protein UA08_02980 [Talaromyces atroroseus]OKL62090.1 hypothetical protein UA08_02980 [Talaromyces atroroseus]
MAENTESSVLPDSKTKENNNATSSQNGNPPPPPTITTKAIEQQQIALPAKADAAAGQAHASPKKRRKVNHACVYCRRSERPCTRCIKRNIGHLCHDEPREPAKKNRGEHEEGGAVASDFGSSHGLPEVGGQSMLPDSSLSIRPSTIDPSQAVQPSPISTAALDRNSQMYGYSGDWAMNGQSQFQDMHTFHPSYMFNAPEVTNEYNLLGDFLNNSLLDDNGMYGNDELQGLFSDSSLINMSTNMNGSAAPFTQQQQLSQLASHQAANAQTTSMQRPTPAVPTDKARENYYMTAADPSGSDPPEERMNKLLKAKYEAGMLRPFNYVKGYARLNQYMEQHMQPALRHKILRQLDKFRPKFRERMQSLTDIELVLSEMWFERSLMEYDRVFASMAIPACCWRRTGEIFRGNKEMAELINVPIENLRDGKLALHQIITEDQLVSYWEKFGAIAFDGSQKAMLTSCTLKSPDDDHQTKGIPCCFSFTIRRDPNAMGLDTIRFERVLMKEPAGIRHAPSVAANVFIFIFIFTFIYSLHCAALLENPIQIQKTNFRDVSALAYGVVIPFIEAPGYNGHGIVECFYAVSAAYRWFG